MTAEHGRADGALVAANRTSAAEPTLPPAPVLPVNTSFSTSIPGLQVAIDSTSLGAFKVCPRRYWYEIVQGWRPRAESVHLQFGIWFHEGCERYDRARAAGAAHEEALGKALRHVLVSTWNRALARPWLSDHPTKNRVTLVRTLVWYLEEFGANDPLETLRLADGRPAVELSFRFGTGLQAPDGSEYLLCGHLDRVVSLGGDPYLVDRKTTGGTLGAHYFADFSPNNQMALYDVAGQVAFGFQLRGLIIDAAQVGAGFTRFQRQPIPRTQAQRDEWWGQIGWWFGQMAECATANLWPMNDRSCGQYGGCPFRPVCSRTPAARDTWLRAEYTRRVWDPLQIRGDV